jgi:CBS domain-containing protein
MSIGGTIGAVLDQKGHDVWSTSPETTVFEAIQTMADKNIGALAVMASGTVVGMVSERDYTRKVVLLGKSSKQTPVRDIMSTTLITVTRENTVEEGLRLMTDHRVRHLPVLAKGVLVGLVSIGNLVNWVISAQHAAIGQLEDYIVGKYPG